MIFFLFFSLCQRDTDVSDLVGEIRKRAGRNSVKINRDVKGSPVHPQALSQLTRIAIMYSSEFRNRGTDKNTLGNDPWNVFNCAMTGNCLLLGGMGSVLNPIVALTWGRSTTTLALEG